MERLDETLHDLESSNECGEVERLAEQLLDIITEDKELYSEAVRQVAQDPDIFLQICRQVGKLDVLQLLADAVSSEEFWSDNIDYDELTSEKETYWSDVIVAASTKRELSCVIEIFYRMCNHRMIPAFPSLVEKLKLFWQEEDLMHGTVILFWELLDKSENLKADKDMLIKTGAILTLSVLFGLLFSKNPSALDLDNCISFPRDPDRPESVEPIASQLVAAVAVTVDGHEDRDYYGKVVKPILPIVRHATEQACQGGVQYVSELFSYRFFEHVTALLCAMFVKGKKSGSIAEKDLQPIISSKVIEHLVVLYADFVHRGLCCKSSHCLEKRDMLLLGIKCFLGALSSAKLNKFTESGRIEILHLMKVFLNNELLFSTEVLEDHYADLCLVFMRDIVMENKDSGRLKELFSDLDNGIVSSMIGFADRNSTYMSKISMNILQTLISFETVGLLQQVLSFPPLCINHLVTSRTIDKPEIIKGIKRDLNNLSVATFKIFHGIICAGTIEQLQEMDDKYNVLDSIVKALKLSKKPKMLETIVHTLVEMVHYYELDFLTPDKLQKILPVVWKKIKVAEDVEVECVELTYRVALLLPKSHPLDYTDLEPFLVEQSAGLLQMKPAAAPLLRLLWEATKRTKHKQLIKELGRISSGKSVGYAAPGKTGQAKIFKMISDLIVGSMEKDPSYETEYLTELTQTMVSIARSCSLDEEMYVLEDMVSPAMWLLEKQSDEKIVANVKEFISILH